MQNSGKANIFLRKSAFCLCAGGAGSREESGWSFTRRSQATAIQRQLPQPSTVHPRHSSQSLAEQTFGQVPGVSSCNISS